MQNESESNGKQDGFLFSLVIKCIHFHLPNYAAIVARTYTYIGLSVSRVHVCDSHCWAMFELLRIC